MNKKCSRFYCITHRVRSLRWGCPPRKECGMSNIKFSNSSPHPFYERIIFVPPLILRKDHLMLGNDENTPKNEIPFPWPGTWLSCHMHTHSIHTTKTQEKKPWGNYTIHKNIANFGSFWEWEMRILFWTNMESFSLNPLDPDFWVRSEGPIREETLPEAQRTQGIESITWVISPAK